MRNGFVKVGTASPKIRVADPNYNVGEMIRLAESANEKGVRVLVFPELCVTGYTCSDLFENDVLIDAAHDALDLFVSRTANLNLLSIVGLPVAFRGKLFNCAAICKGGELLALVPKTVIPNYSEFYEARQFASAPAGVFDLTWNETVTVPFGTDILLSCRELPDLRIACEICEDLWAPIAPSCRHTAAGATLICNPSASNDTVGKDDYRKKLVEIQSGKCVCAYIYASCGEGESTTDIVFGGHSLICENGSTIAERLPFDFSNELLITEIDLQRIAFDRRRMNTFFADFTEKYREIRFSLPFEETKLTRFIDPHPFVPAKDFEREKRCETILTIQTQGLKQRIERAFAKKVVVGISGGLDSTLALLVMVRAMDELKRPRTDVIAVTMPCFGTTKRTKSNATVLCEELGVDFRCVDIKNAVDVHFADIGHNQKDTNVTFENAQARERTQVLMDIANDCGGMVIGTGDLSELALGWATYNGDHMSMYGVNGSVPKTLIRHIVSYVADKEEKNGRIKIATALRDVLATPVSPELLPADQNGEISQKTEDLVGPYEIHDFYIYYFVRFGFSPDKLFRLAKYALGDLYSDEILLKWLKGFIKRFFSQQFKRSCLPDGPKVGSVALSPRGDWRMPSDASCAAWLKEAEALDQ